VRLHVLVVGDRPPRWVDDACAGYLQRFPPHCPLYVKTVPMPRRGKNPDIARLRQKEYQALSACIPEGAHVVALDEHGKSVTTEQVASRLDHWMHHLKDVGFLIGGPDGLDPSALREAPEKWSLSPLTLPHLLARVVIIEQIYRALTVLADHPYHRGH